MKYISLILVGAFALLLASCTSGEMQKSPFSITETDQKIQLMENGKPVFEYQKKPKSLNGKYICNNYIHPLYNLDGDTLTEEFPPDHPYHRGIFWAWHQLYAGNQRLGDGWVNDSISQEVVNTGNVKTKEMAQFRLEVLWHSSVLDEKKAFLKEKTIITVHKLEGDLRKIDFEIQLNALVKDLQIGGSADPKGYGGFCARIKLHKDLIFTSETGPVTPAELQIKAGPWMDFSGKFGNGPEISGLTLLCHPSMPDYPESWILRQKGSMQNIVFPGSARIDIPMDKPVVLRYRLIIHKAGSGSNDIPKLLQEYSEMKTN